MRSVGERLLQKCARESDEVAAIARDRNVSKNLLDKPLLDF